MLVLGMRRAGLCAARRTTLDAMLAHAPAAHPAQAPLSLPRAVPRCAVPRRLLCHAAARSHAWQPLSGQRPSVRHRPLATVCSATKRIQLSNRRAGGSSTRPKKPKTVAVSVDILLEGSPSAVSQEALQELAEFVQSDAEDVIREALLRRAVRDQRYKLPHRVEVAVVLCDDEHIRSLNLQHRGKDVATDVLSFDMADEMDYLMHLPVKLLGDLVISLDTANAQAEERGHDLLDEIRVLLVHGVLHLCGLDHEAGHQQLLEHAQEEAAVMAALEWEGQGLIESCGALEDEADWPQGAGPHSAATPSASSGPITESPSTNNGDFSPRDPSTTSSSTGASASASSSSSSIRYRSSEFKVVALDMDGTLLDSSSRIPPSAARAVRAALEAGVQVVLATGKARPAAISACREAGLAGDGLLVWERGPGVFLQGLAVHGSDGGLLSDASLPWEVVADALAWSQARHVSCCAFLGDTCATLRLTPELELLHTRYYEPLSQEVGDLEALRRLGAVKKLLFMASPDQIAAEVRPEWQRRLRATAKGAAARGASVMQAVPEMLEVVPAGVDKWGGLQLLLDHFGLPAEALMAVGDGSNDLGMVGGAGLGVAMGNAVPEVKAAASVVVSSNDDGGVAEALERYVL